MALKQYIFYHMLGPNTIPELVKCNFHMDEPSRPCFSPQKKTLASQSPKPLFHHLRHHGWTCHPSSFITSEILISGICLSEYHFQIMYSVFPLYQFLSEDL